MPNPAPSDNETGRQPALAGAYTVAEILSQPRCWAMCLEQVESSGIIAQISQHFGTAREWLFVGCGSSYYLSLAAAASWTAITGNRARAVPASEVLLFPDLVFKDVKEFAPVLVSRSGQTSEVLMVAQRLKERGIQSLAVTCTTGQRLEKLATLTILLPQADEESTVMTRSVTSMLLSLQYLGASLAGNSSLRHALNSLPPPAEKVLQDLPGRVRELVHKNTFSSYVCLGQGPYFGLACESALKIMEMSRSFAQAFHTLEFRHGPKAIVNDATLLTFLLSEANYDAELEVLEEMKELGGKTLAVANHITDRARASADLVVEIDCDLPEPSCVAPFVFAGQLLGFYTALRKGLDPDRPPNLSRAVILEDEKEQRENAPI